MSAPIKHLKPADYRVMPWKNGGGSTTEIAVQTAASGDFTWRVSMADLSASGPFSVFTGVERVIVPIAGPAFRLTHGDQGSQLVSPLTPYCFSGDWQTAAELTAPGRDYNVMIRRTVGSAWVDVLTLQPGAPWTRTYLNRTIVLTSIASELDLTIGSERLSLKAFESLIVNRAEATLELSAQATAHVIVSEIRIA